MPMIADQVVEAALPQAEVVEAHVLVEIMGGQAYVSVREPGLVVEILDYDAPEDIEDIGDLLSEDGLVIDEDGFVCKQEILHGPEELEFEIGGES